MRCVMFTVICYICVFRPTHSTLGSSAVVHNTVWGDQGVANYFSTLHSPETERRTADVSGGSLVCARALDLRGSFSLDLRVSLALDL